MVEAAWEKDIVNVLQTHQIFTDIHTGSKAKKADIKKLFGKKSDDEIIDEILMNGEYKINKLERDVNLKYKRNEMIQVICDRTINPETCLPYPPQIIETALEKLKFTFSDQLNAKRNSHRAIYLLCSENDVINIKKIKQRYRIEYEDTICIEFKFINTSYSLLVIFDSSWALEFNKRDIIL